MVAEAPLFRELPPDAQAALAAAARKVVLRPGQELFRQDAPADAVYVVLSGRVRVLQTSASGQAVVLRVLGPGEMVGLVAALGSSRYPVTAIAVKTCVAARWWGAELWAVMEKHPKIATGALRMVLARLHELQEQYRELATEKVERRIARALVRLVRQAGKRVDTGVRIDMPLSRQDLAEMTGTTLFTVSRILHAWGVQGLVESKRQQVTILRPHALIMMSEDLPHPDREPE